MGLYESKQLVNLFDAVKLWCARAGLEYSGGLGISAGELLGVLAGKLPFGAWPTRKVAAGMRDLAAAIDGDGSVGDIFAEPNGFPRSLYIWIANTNWNRTARKNDLTPEDLYRRL